MKKVHLVTVVCENILEEYEIYEDKAEATAKYLELCERWYIQDAVELWSMGNEDMSKLALYNNYPHSSSYDEYDDRAIVRIDEVTIKSGGIK